MIEHGVEKVEAVPNVEDPTLPPATTDATPPRYLVAVVGTPTDLDIAVFHADDPLGIGFTGYCTWQSQTASPPTYAWVYLTTIDETGATVLMLDDDGSPILTYVPVS